jgi:hypothetical protein
MHQKRASDLITSGCEPPCGCWDLNSGPSEEQSLLLTTEPSLQPYIVLFVCFTVLKIRLWASHSLGKLDSRLYLVKVCKRNGFRNGSPKHCSLVLQINKDDVTALHCKVVCLIQNGSFKEALNVINTHTKVLAK